MSIVYLFEEVGDHLHQSNQGFEERISYLYIPFYKQIKDE